MQVLESALIVIIFLPEMEGMYKRQRITNQHACIFGKLVSHVITSVSVHRAGAGAPHYKPYPTSSPDYTTVHRAPFLKS